MLLLIVGTKANQHDIGIQSLPKLQLQLLVDWLESALAYKKFQIGKKTLFVFFQGN